MQNKDAPGVFVPEKKHNKKRKTLLIVEISLLVLVLLGTTAFFLKESGFSFSSLGSRLSKAFSLQSPPAKKTSSTFTQTAKDEIDKKILNIVDISVGEGFVDIKTKEGVEIFLDVKKDLDDQVETLQTLLSKAKIDKREIVFVDFRFEKLVVQYK